MEYSSYMHGFLNFQTNLIRTFGIGSLEEFCNFWFKMLQCLVSGSRFWIFSMHSARIFRQEKSHSLPNILRSLQFNIHIVRPFHCYCNDSKRFQNFKCRICMFSAPINIIIKIWCKIIMTFYVTNLIVSMQHRKIKISYNTAEQLSLWRRTTLKNIPWFFHN